ncbi:histidine kinase dimerization/phospho-acceptor domain-containing protein [Paraburkholderia nodosa]|uniref:histidine kinase dimerization/phospho-acceptor domain-containing protein n=1 Tax=Paraburkholderia nodosa TaxID=392320 RepID=UPI0004891C88|nr:histidine kinase dimerization/phospho-acceptor domain-containing protein [Paraburkholderia nodosa]
MTRFNEAIDQVLAESVRHYVMRTERIRDLFAGVLAHDLRSPLGAILNSSEVLLHDEGLSAVSARALAFVQRGALRMRQMIDDCSFLRVPAWVTHCRWVSPLRTWGAYVATQRMKCVLPIQTRSSSYVLWATSGGDGTAAESDS